MTSTDYVVVDEVGDPAGSQQFFLYDEMFPVEPATSKAKRPDDAAVTWEPLTWEWVVPNFSVNEVAKFFFGLGAHWLRWRYHPSRSDRYPDGYVVLDGAPLESKRTPHNIRYYTLPDVERLAHALAQTGAISGEKLVKVVELVRAEARVHGVES